MLPSPPRVTDFFTVDAFLKSPYCKRRPGNSLRFLPSILQDDSFPPRHVGYHEMSQNGSTQNFFYANRQQRALQSRRQDSNVKDKAPAPERDHAMDGRLKGPEGHVVIIGRTDLGIGFQYILARIGNRHPGVKEGN